MNFQDGVLSGGAATLPAKEDCPACAKIKNADGFCGIVEDRDYDNPLDQSGNPLILQPQAIYSEGQIIDMEFVYTINHNGHHVIYACPNHENPTTECFLNNPLEFMEDISLETYGTNANAPKDPNYPERGYVNPSATHTKMRFKLPEGVTGDLVLLQWHWIAGDSCQSAGYESYAYPPGWAPSNLAPCPDRPDLNPVGLGNPQQYWNCMDVQIVTSEAPTPPPSLSPTIEPTTIHSYQPTTSPSLMPTTSPTATPTAQSTTTPTTKDTTAPSWTSTHKPSLRPIVSHTPSMDIVEDVEEQVIVLNPQISAFMSRLNAILLSFLNVIIDLFNF